MGRLVRRYIRAYNLTVANRVLASVTRTISATVDLVGLKSAISIPTGVTITGTTWGIWGGHIDLDLVGTASVTPYLGGLLIETTSPVGSTVGTGVYGIWVSNYLLGTTPTDYHMIRLQENGTAVIRTFIYMRPGANGATYAFWMHGDGVGAWQASGTCSTQVGWVKCMIAGVVKYIALYQSVA